MAEIQNLKRIDYPQDIEYVIEMFWLLELVIWDFSAVSGEAIRFDLNQLELTLTLSQ